MSQLQRIHITIPARLGVGESFPLKVKLLGETRIVPQAGSWCHRGPQYASQFNLLGSRMIRFLDDVLPAWSGALTVELDGGLNGAGECTFDGEDQGVYGGDTRPVKIFEGFTFTEPGFHFVTLTDPATGISGTSNPVYVSEEAPRSQIYFGDPHWQTYFSDGVRGPEELYTFARDEAFLDFGAISDHMEAITDRQWEYFQGVSNDFNEDGRFATLIGQEWTSMGAGHRNIYYRGDSGPVVRSTDPEQDDLPKLWKVLDHYTAQGGEAVAIPHHSSNVMMGCDWDLGWNPTYEKSIEMASVWGSSECHADDGNIRPLRHCDGEMRGRHVRDALARGYRFAFVGGGDVHDGRPGEAGCLLQPDLATAHETWPQGLTAAILPELTREALFDAIRDGRTYATTCRRVYLDTALRDGKVTVAAASTDGIASAVLVHNGAEEELTTESEDPRIHTSTRPLPSLAGNDYAYIRITTESGDMAWSSPWFA
ncbi:MAG: DUF3604 domain-containing protein [Planctomycetota bacterium]|jgi:hypothetical protein